MMNIWRNLVDRSNERRWLLYLALLTLALMFTPAARAMVILLPLATAYLSFRFIHTDRAAFIELLCWLYVLCPFVRRVVDYKSDSTETILLALPLLALLAPVYVLLKRWTHAITRRSAPFGYVLIGISYGSVLAILSLQVKALLPVLPLWLLPTVLGLYVFNQRAEITVLFAGFERSMVGCTLFAGVYGLVQYMYLPVWDAVWVEGTGINTFGKPRPYEVRVFSTLNAPQILGAFMMIGILIALRSRHLLRWLAISFGFVALALSAVRSAWIAFAVSLVYLTMRSSRKERVGVVLFLGGCAVIVSSASIIPQAREMLEARLDSLVDVKNDYSANDRSEQLDLLLKKLAISPFGQGIGVEESDAQHDSSITNILLCLGEFGTAIFLCGIVLILSRTFLARAIRTKPLLLTTQICLVALVVEFPLNNILSGPVAFLLWFSLGTGYALTDKSQVALN